MVKVESLRAERKFKKTEIGEIPVDWKVLRVKDVCEKPEYGYTASAVEKPLGPKFLRITDIQDGKVIWNNVPYCNCPDNLKERYIIRSGDILFARTGATTGKSYLIKDCPEAVFASYLIRVAVNEQIDSHFLYSLFNSSIYWRQITQQMGGSAQGGVNASSLANIKIPFPPLSEQKKIADILSTVDEAIEKNNLVIEKTKELKKGLMQELLTRGIGHKKLKKTEIGKIPVDWEVTTLDEISEEIYRYPTYFKIEYVAKGVPEVRGELIKLNGAFDLDLSKYRFISPETASQFPRTCLKEGDFVLSVRGTMGKVAIVPKSLNGANITANLIRISPDRQKIFPLFLHQIFISQKFQETLNITSSSTTIKTIKAPELKKIKFSVPPLQEQKKIAEILLTVDKIVENEITHEKGLEKIRKALMQVLLTGKVRVKN